MRDQGAGASLFGVAQEKSAQGQLYAPPGIPAREKPKLVLADIALMFEKRLYLIAARIDDACIVGHERSRRVCECATTSERKRCGETGNQTGHALVTTDKTASLSEVRDAKIMSCRSL